MIAKAPRKLKSGNEFNGLISRAKPQYRQVLAEANTTDTLKLIKQVVAGSLDQTRLLANRLKGNTLNATCKNIWTFIYEHIQYAKDTPGAEEIRDPGRTWADRKKPGVDCDDYTVFTSSILTNLGIPHVLRVTAYGGDWQHIYVVVPKDGNAAKSLDQSRRNDYITLDDVTDHYDFEVKYTKKQDIPMTLNHLSGLPAHLQQPNEMSGLGKTIFGKALQKVGKVAKKAVNVVKTVATTPIRLGVLAWMKLNFKGAAERLRFGYLPYNDVVAKSKYGPAAHAKLVDSLRKLNNTFTKTLGGQANTLRMAILTGNGNKGREVPSTAPNLSGFGFGELPVMQDPDFEAMMQMTSLNAVIRPNAINGLGALGIEPVSSTALITAATAIMVPILNLLSKAKAGDPGDPIPPQYLPEPEYVEDDLDAIVDDGSYAEEQPAEEPAESEPEGDGMGAVDPKKAAAARVKAAVTKQASAGKPVTPAQQKAVVKAKTVVPAKKAVVPAVKVATPVKKAVVPAVKVATPVKKAVVPAKPVTPAAKAVATKQAVATVKKAVATVKKTAAPAAKKVAAKQAVATVKKAVATVKQTPVKAAVKPAVVKPLAPKLKTAIKVLPTVKQTLPAVPVKALQTAPAPVKKKTAAGSAILAVRKAANTVAKAVTSPLKKKAPVATPAKKAAVKKVVQTKAVAAKQAEQAGDQETATQLKAENAEMVREILQTQRQPAPEVIDNEIDLDTDYTPAPDPVQARLTKVANTVQRVAQYADAGTAIVTQAKAIATGKPAAKPSAVAADDEEYADYEELTDDALVAAGNDDPNPKTSNVGTIAAVGFGMLLLGALFNRQQKPGKKSLSGLPAKRKAKATYKGNRSKTSKPRAKSSKRTFEGIDL